MRREETFYLLAAAGAASLVVVLAVAGLACGLACLLLATEALGEIFFAVLGKHALFRRAGGAIGMRLGLAARLEAFEFRFAADA